MKEDKFAKIGDIVFSTSYSSNTVVWDKGKVVDIFPYGDSNESLEYCIEISPGKEILEYHSNITLIQ